MKIEIKKLSYNKRLSEDTNCFSCDVYIDGVKSGTAENRGDGGPTMVWLNDSALQREVEDYCRKLPPVQGQRLILPMNLSFKIDLLVEEELEMRQYRRWCKKKLIIRLKNDPEGDFRTFKVPYTEEYAKQVRERYGDELDYILNERV